MSGGSYDYAYHKVEQMADDLEHSYARQRIMPDPEGYDVPDSKNPDKDPRRALFAKFLWQVAKAMHAIEWVDSADWGTGDEYPHIEAVYAWVKENV